MMELDELKLLLNVMPWQAMIDLVAAVPVLITLVPPDAVLVPIQRSLLVVGTLPGIQLEEDAAEKELSAAVPTQILPALFTNAA